MAPEPSGIASGLVARLRRGARSRAAAPRRAPASSARRGWAARAAGACRTASARRPPARPGRGSAAMRRSDLPLDGRNPPPDVEPQVERHLLVARPPGVEALARVADARDELALDERVHVLVGPVDERGICAGRLEQRLERVADAAASSADSTPASASASAHARLPTTSSSNRRRSKRERRAPARRRRRRAPRRIVPTTTVCSRWLPRRRRSTTGAGALRAAVSAGNP